MKATLDKEREEVRMALRVLWKPRGGRAPHQCSSPSAAQGSGGRDGGVVAYGARPGWAGHAQGNLMPQPVRADYQRDYQPLEKLRLDRYGNEPQTVSIV